MEFTEIFNSIGGANFSGFVLFLKVISALISVALVIGIIYSWFGIQKVSQINQHKRHEHFSLSRKNVSKNSRLEHWNTIVSMFQSQDETSWRMAIIDADAMLEDLITQIGFTGQTFGEKLKKMQQENIPWVQSVWDVHLLRNKLAHEGSRYLLSDREAYRVFKIYESIFQKTGYLA